MSCAANAGVVRRAAVFNQEGRAKRRDLDDRRARDAPGKSRPECCIEPVVAQNQRPLTSADSGSAGQRETAGAAAYELVIAGAGVELQNIAVAVILQTGIRPSRGRSRRDAGRVANT